MLPAFKYADDKTQVYCSIANEGIEKYLLEWDDKNFQFVIREIDDNHKTSMRVSDFMYYVHQMYYPQEKICISSKNEGYKLQLEDYYVKNNKDIVLYFAKKFTRFYSFEEIRNMDFVKHADDKTTVRVFNYYNFNYYNNRPYYFKNKLNFGKDVRFVAEPDFIVSQQTRFTSTELLEMPRLDEFKKNMIVVIDDGIKETPCYVVECRQCDIDGAKTIDLICVPIFSLEEDIITPIGDNKLAEAILNIKRFANDYSEYEDSINSLAEKFGIANSILKLFFDMKDCNKSNECDECTDSQKKTTEKDMTDNDSECKVEEKPTDTAPTGMKIFEKDVALKIKSEWDKHRNEGIDDLINKIREILLSDESEGRYKFIKPSESTMLSGIQSKTEECPIVSLFVKSNLVPSEYMKHAICKAIGCKSAYVGYHGIVIETKETTLYVELKF